MRKLSKTQRRILEAAQRNCLVQSYGGQFKHTYICSEDNIHEVIERVRIVTLEALTDLIELDNHKVSNTLFNVKRYHLTHAGRVEMRVI